MRLTLLTAMLLSMAGCVLSARILAVLPFLGKSHHIFHSSVLKALSQRGHEILEYSPFPPTKPMPNYTHIEVHTNLEQHFNNMNFEEVDKTVIKPSFFGASFIGLWEFLYGFCDEVFKDVKIKELLTSKEKYDLVIVTYSFGQDSFVVFGHKFGAPTVNLQAFTYSSHLNRDAGNDLSIASIPDSMSFVFSDRMTFMERLRNFLSVSVTLFTYYYSHLPRHEAIVRRHYACPEMPPLAELVANVSLTLINTHPAVEHPRPYTPNIVPIGGITITPDRTPLPQDLKSFMDNAKEGVIYFSFGTNLPVHTMPQDVLQVFINVFRRLPQRVLWKIEADRLAGLSDNVRLVKWAPQMGVLSHANCVAMISHGGLFTFHEVMYAGVPIVGIPFFADQPFNLKLAEQRGFGIKVDFNSLTENSLHSALTEVLTNPEYRENARKLSRIYRDMPMSPADSAVFWVEYVLRHGGTHHLRSAASRLAWYQLALLDVLAVCLAAVLSVLTILYLALTRLLAVCRNYKQNHVPSIKKKN